MSPARRATTTGQPAVRALVERARETLATRGMLEGGERLLLAVSGGPDSIAMMHVMHRLAPELKLTLHVATFDHRLRDGSAADARYVERQARALGIPVTAGVAASTERTPGRSPEEDARRRRLGFIESVARETGAERIATAHTRDDQAETVLMRLLHGTGRRGLGGISPVRWWYIRPLLDVRRAEVEAFCKAAGLRPRRDPTNQDRSILRNAIRHETIPYLRDTMNAHLVDALARMADVLRDEDAYLDEVAAEAAAPVLGDGGEARLPVETLAALPEALQRRAIRLLTWTATGAVFTAQHTERLRLLALGNQTGQTLDLPEGLRASVEYGFLVVDRASSPSTPPSASLEVPGETDVVPWGLRVRSWIANERPVEWPDGKRKCVLDADRVSSPLRVRRWRSGDRFRPLGMSRRKKVGDFFTDVRVPARERGKVPLIVGTDDEIVWVVGHRMDDRCKVTDRTTRFLWLKVEGS